MIVKLKEIKKFERGKMTLMDTAASDLSDSFEGEKQLKSIIMNSDEIQIANIIEEIKTLVNKYNNPKKYLNDYLKKVEENMENLNFNESIDRVEIKKQIEKHPYFKNPCNYHIRLLTIMKYLKKKGFNINIQDIDLVVDDIIQEIDGVEKIGEGRYTRNYKGNRRS